MLANFWVTNFITPNVTSTEKVLDESLDLKYQNQTIINQQLKAHYQAIWGRKLIHTLVQRENKKVFQCDHQKIQIKHPCFLLPRTRYKNNSQWCFLSWVFFRTYICELEKRNSSFYFHFPFVTFEFTRHVISLE